MHYISQYAHVKSTYRTGAGIHTGSSPLSKSGEKVIVNITEGYHYR